MSPPQVVVKAVMFFVYLFTYFLQPHIMKMAHFALSLVPEGETASCLMVLAMVQSRHLEGGTSGRITK